MSRALTLPRPFLRALAGHTLSQVGSFLNFIAIDLFVLALTKSALQTGLFKALRLLGSFLAGTYGSVWVDRISRRKVMIFSDIAQGILLVILTLGAMYLGPDHKRVLLFPLSFFLGIFSILGQVSLQAAIPSMIGEKNKEELLKANAWVSASRGLAMGGGLFLGGWLLNFVSVPVIFGLDALSFFVSAVNLIFLKIRTESDLKTTPATSKKRLEELKETFSYIRSLPFLGIILMLRFFDSIGSASHNLGIPLYANALSKTHMGLTEYQYMSWIWGMWALGEILGARLITWAMTGGHRHKLKDKKWVRAFFYGSTFMMSLFFIGLFQFSSLTQIAPLALLAGISDGVALILYNQGLQEAPDHLRGKVFGASATIVTLGFGFGMVGTAYFFDLYTPGSVVALFHGIPFVMALILFIKTLMSTRTPVPSEGSRPSLGSGPA